MNEQSFATIGTVYADGVTLIFDGEAESTKRYKVNTSIVFTAGNRVKVAADSGTYVVEYIVGSPITTLHADTATSAQTLGVASGSTIGFYGTAPIVRQTISLASNNMGYTSVTSENYLFAINNIIGILKVKYGIII